MSLKKFGSLSSFKLSILGILYSNNIMTTFEKVVGILFVQHDSCFMYYRVDVHE